MGESGSQNMILKGKNLEKKNSQTILLIAYIATDNKIFSLWSYANSNAHHRTMWLLAISYTRKKVISPYANVLLCCQNENDLKLQIFPLIFLIAADIVASY